MERKEQTGHICRWMALGIMTAIVIVGCTIVIGLFEWRDRKEIECRNAELHQWRKNVHDLNLHITELSLLGEMVADWDSTDVNEYHSLRLEVDSMLEGIAGICSKEDSDTICRLLAEKEQLLLDIKDAMQDMNATQEKLTAEVPRIVEQNKTESKRLSAMPQQAKPKKRGFFSRLFGKKENRVTTGNRLTQTEKMLANLNQTVVAKHHQQSRKVVEILDSLGNRNEGINKQLQRVISIADENVDKGIKVRERQIADLEGNYIYYYIGMIGLLILVFFVLFLLVWRFAFKTRKSKEETRNVMLTVTHEMRSPLSAIKDYARKISGLEDATDESKRYADLIVDTSKGLTSMIDSFLVYSKLANGKATVKERPFRMMDIAEHLKMEYEPFAAKKQLELSVSNKADGVVNGDKEKVLTIGRNLLSNAIKYTGKGEIVLSTTYKNGVFILKVKDSGTGLDDKQQKQIFKEFARLGNAVTQPGFGLGLSIVKNLVSLMKGKIDVSSNQGLGSIFTISLPMAAAEKQNVGPIQYRTKRQDSFTVIAIDDSHVQLSTIREAFASNGIVCDTCNNATDLLDMMRKKSYDLLITDLKMAEVNGIEILEMMRMVNVRNSKTIPPATHHCVLEATGNYSALLVYLLSEAGITVSLENPLKIKNFARVMLTVIKTDEIDARLIALYGEKMQPAPYKLRSDAILVLKQKRTVLRQLKKQLVATRNLKGSMEVLPFFDPKCKKTIEKTIVFLEKQIKEMEEELASLAQGEYKKQMDLLTSIKGIGVTLAAALIVATGGFTYFDNAKQLTRYLGLSPTYQQSGTSVNVKGHINRNGDSALRSQLYVAAFSSLRCNTECKACFDRLRSNGKPGKVAVIAVANKLVRQAFAVVTQGKPYVDGFKSEKP